MKKIFILAAAALLAVVACNKSETPVVPSKGGPVRFATNLNSYTVKAFSLAENDQIGVFAGAPITRINVLGTVTSSKGVAFAAGSEICWQAGQTAATTFAACYPYNASCDATAADPFKFSFSVPSDQSSAENAAAADLLTAVAANVAVPADPETADPVSLTFGHQGAKFVINITKEISAAIEDVEILDTKLAGVVDMATRTVGSLSQPGIIHAFRPVASANSFEAIILPAEAIAPKIRVTVEGGTSYTYSMEGTMTFVAGKQYTAAINISSNPVSADAVSFTVGDITDWEVVETPLSYGGNPEVDSHVWSVIGQVNGLTEWTEDFPMSQIENGVNPEDGKWEITFTVAEGPDSETGEGGSEFKIRWAHQWGDGSQAVSSNNVVSIGMDPSWWYVDGKGENDEGLQLWQANAKNIKCKEAGTYKLTLFYPSCKVFVEKQ